MGYVLELLSSLSTLSVTVRLVLALVCGGLIGIERETKRRSAGFRTHVLIAMGSAMTALLGQYISSQGVPSDPLRISAQVVAGVGFIGAGAIIVTRRRETKGLTTAAGLWTTAIIGIAAGAGCYIEVIVATLSLLLVELLLSRLEYRLISSSRIINVYVELEEKSGMYRINDYITEKKIEVIGTQISKDTSEDGISVMLTLKLPKDENQSEHVVSISTIEGVRRALDIQ
ncbi:MAG: MgtC/SapB family protein [Clostridia bacterium]|nr:MgtC/SapB family protein [Clostridia bacterium]